MPQVDHEFGVKLIMKPVIWSRSRSIYTSDIYTITKISDTRWSLTWRGTSRSYEFRSLSLAKIRAETEFEKATKKRFTMQYQLIAHIHGKDTVDTYIRGLVEHIAALPPMKQGTTVIDLATRMAITKDVIQYILDHPS